jgi:acyl-CoA thioester hydrolase
MDKRADLPIPEGFRFRCPIEPRFRDLDPMGHVNNAVYFTYFEIGRTGYMRAIGHWPEDDRPMSERFPFILLKIDCQYLSPARAEDRLEVQLRTDKIGTKSFEFDYLLLSRNDDRTVAVGHSVQVYYDYLQASPQPIPAAFRDKLLRFEGALRG